MKNFTLTLTVLICSLYCQSQTFSNAILMDGQNDYITVNDNSNLNQTSTISIEAWIRPCEITNSHVVVSKNWCANNQNAYTFRVESGNLEWVWDNDQCGIEDDIYRSDSAIILPDVWQHVAVVHTTTGVTLYLNGTPVNGTLISGNYSNIQVSNEPLRIGAYKFLAGNIGSLFYGFMDEVRIWDYDLSSAEILSRYNSELIGTETGLVGYYNMNAISGSGSGLNVVNNATNTGDILDGITIGTSASPSVVAFNESNCPSQENNSLTCSDGIDNDNDTLVDCDDPDCQNLGNDGCAICNEGITFADLLIEYESGCTLADANPEGALGVSDYPGGNNDIPEFVFLGQGGFIKLGFTNNILTNSGDSNFDVYVFEVGAVVEATTLELRPADIFTQTELNSLNIPDMDEDGFYEFGSIGGSTSGFDIDNVMSGYDQQALKFDAIKIMDVVDGSCSGDSPGADIDAVCALSSLTLSTDENIMNQNFVKLYPNPTTGHISIDLGETKNNLKLSLINYLGQVVLTKEFVSTDFINIGIDVPAGVYFLHLETAEGERNIIKVLKQ